MDVTDSGHVLNQEKPDPNHDAQNVLLAAEHVCSHPASCNSRQSSSSSDTPSAGAVQVGHVKLSRNLDGGYGWVIVMASFFVAFVVDGIGSSFGLLFPYIKAKFDSSDFVTSFAGSTFVAFTIMGSISAVLVKKIGFRLVALTGSTLSCVAFVASIFSPNIYVFIVTFGVLGGCSCGLVFIPSIIIVNEYFHQKRGIVNGIISSGSGVGLLVLGPLINLLLDAFSLDGTILVLAGILLNMCVLSSLFRCPEHAASLVDRREQQAYGQLAVESLSSNLSTDDLEMWAVDKQPEVLKATKHETQRDTTPAFDVGQGVRKYCNTYLRKSVDKQPEVLKATKHETQRDTTPAFDVGQGVRKYCNTYLRKSVDKQPEVLKATKHETERDTTPAFDVSQGVRKYCNTYLRKSAADPIRSDDHGESANFYLDYVLHHLKPGASAHFHQHTPAQGTGPEHKHAYWNSQMDLASTTMPHIVKHHHSYSVFDIPTWCQDKDRHQVLQYIRQRYKHFGDHYRVHQPHATSCRHSQSLSIDQASNCYLAGSISTLLNLHNSFVHAVSQSGLKSIHSLSSKLHNDTEHSGGIWRQHSGDIIVTAEQLLAHNTQDGDIEDAGKCLLANKQHDCPEPGQAAQSSQAGGRPGYTGRPADDYADVSEQSELDLPLGYSMAQLLCMPSFYFFCLGAALIQIGYPLAGTFLANYAYQFGLTTSHTTVLMSLLGGLNVCGRLLAGFLVSLKMDPLFLNNLSLLLGGAACLLSPLYSQFWSLCVFAGMFGFFLGFFPPLQPLIIVKHFGLNTLASAFGFLSTVKGVASILGAPLAGFIYDVTKQYSMSFMFGGGVFVLSSLVHCLMTLSDKCCRRTHQL